MPMRDDEDFLLQRAWAYAAEKHAAQRIPGTEINYLGHVGLVYSELASAHLCEPLERPLLAFVCGILHDTIEDQGATHEELDVLFGVDVADGVLALSKDGALPKELRMADSLRRIREQPREVWCVKLADRISNLFAPPAHWSESKARAYRNEAGSILRELGAASPFLARRLAAQIERYPHAAITLWQRQEKVSAA